MIKNIERARDGMDSLVDRTRDAVVGAADRAERGVESAAEQVTARVTLKIDASLKTGVTLLIGVAGWLAMMMLGSTTVQAEPASEVDVSTAEIRFRVSGLRNDKGSLVCGLFDSESWLGDGTPGEGGTIQDGEAICLFRDIAPGAYGISAYHDQNGNGKLDSNFLRIPKEGTTASNDARGKMGPPKFEDAKFEYDGGSRDFEAEMVYR